MLALRVATIQSESFESGRMLDVVIRRNFIVVKLNYGSALESNSFDTISSSSKANCNKTSGHL